MALTMTWPQHQNQQCGVDGRRVHLTRSERDVLAVLLMRAPGVVPLDDLIEGLYPDPEREPEQAQYSIHTHIANLRRKIGRWRIATRHGQGWYILQTQPG